MKVRFKIPTCEFGRIAYELYSTDVSYQFDDGVGKYMECYELIGLGFVPVEYLEFTDGIGDVAYTDFLIKLYESTSSL